MRCFERLAREGRRALAASAPGRAAADLREALALWRGAPLVDVGDEPFVQAEIARLEELRAGVIEDRIEADLALGGHADVIGELEVLVAALSAAGAAVPAADDRAVPVRAAGGGAGRLPVGTAGCWWRNSALSQARHCKRVERAILVQDAALDARRGRRSRTGPRGWRAFAVGGRCPPRPAADCRAAVGWALVVRCWPRCSGCRRGIRRSRRGRTRSPSSTPAATC